MNCFCYFVGDTTNSGWSPLKPHEHERPKLEGRVQTVPQIYCVMRGIKEGRGEGKLREFSNQCSLENEVQTLDVRCWW